MNTRETGLKYMFDGTLPQVIAALAGTITLISDGMHYGWSAPTIPILQSEDSPIKITQGDENLLESLYMIGGILAMPGTIYLVDKIGRRNCVMLASCTSLLAWVLIALAPNVLCLYVARFLAGAAGDIGYVSIPMYVAEIAHQKIRGFLLGVTFLMLYVGILSIYVVAPFTPLYGPAIVGCIVLVIQLTWFTFMPKSPYYLLGRNRPEPARKALNKLRRNEDNKQEFEEMSRMFKSETEEKGTFLDLVLVKSNRKALLYTTVVNVSQQFSGVNVMLMNMNSILMEAKSAYLSSDVTAILFSVIMLASAICASLVIDKYGRKALLLTSSVLTSTCLLVLAIYFNLDSVGYDITSISWVPVLCILVYAAAFQIGLGLVVTVVNAEMFANNVKAVGMTFQDIVFCIFGLISIEMYEEFSHAYGKHVPFYLFAVLSGATAIFTTLKIPETKGKTLEEIQLLLKGEKPLKAETYI